MKNESKPFAKCVKCGNTTDSPNDINQRCRRIVKGKRCKGTYRSTLTPWEQK